MGTADCPSGRTTEILLANAHGVILSAMIAGGFVGAMCRGHDHAAAP